jgi:hypothetical protein
VGLREVRDLPEISLQRSLDDASQAPWFVERPELGGAEKFWTELD